MKSGKEKRHAPVQSSRTNVTPSRRAAALILRDLRGGTLLDASFEERSAGLEYRDRRWLQELVRGTLRRRAWIDAVVETRVRAGLASVSDDLMDLLRLGVYQLIAMDSVPAYAAIGQTVELAREAGGRGAASFVNAVLRRIDRERNDLDPVIPAFTSQALALLHSHPQWLVERWLERFPADEVEALLIANNQAAPAVARPWNVPVSELAAELQEAGVTVERSPLLADSLVIGGGARWSTIPAFTEGRFFMQDPGATLVTMFSAFPEGATVLDMCAAPGGKTLELSRTAATVVATDRSPERVRRMAHGLERLGTRNIHLAVADAERPPIRQVDCVLTDVPCSGTGTFRRHPDARWRLSPSSVATLTGLQYAILESAAKCVRPGGLLVYSTCSLETDENDAIADTFLREHPEFTEEPPQDGIVPDRVLDGNRLRTFPHIHGCDGAFAVRMRKSGR